jgi:hypothetical protein
MTIEFDQFLAVDMRVGRVVEVQDFPEARKPAWKLTIDFGPELGRKRSSAQIAEYAREELDRSSSADARLIGRDPAGLLGSRPFRRRLS